MTASFAEPPRGVWVKLFQALVQAGGPPAQVLMDSFALKAQCSAAGGIGGRLKRSAALVAADRPRSTP